MVTTTHPTHESKRQRTVRAFDIRLIIALLFTVYGLTLTTMGLAFTTAADISMAGGLNINLGTGISMLVFAATVAVWAWRRPVTVDVPE